MDQAVEQPTLVQMEPPNFKEAWQMVTHQLRMEMKRADYETWIQALEPLSYKDGVFRVGSINSYGRDWVESRLRTRITRLLEAIFNQPVTVHFILRHAGVGAQELPLAVMESEVQATGAAMDKMAMVASNTAPGDPFPPKTITPGETSGGVDSNVPAGEKKRVSKTEFLRLENGSPRKIQLQRAYGTERARVVQPERGMFLTKYFFTNWLPLLGHSAMTTVLAARSLCYWNPLNGELRNTVETDMSELARLASVSVRTVKDVLNTDLVKRYFLRYKVRRIMTPNGVRTAGIRLQVRMDDPLTPEDQDLNHLPEEERWYTADFEDESEE